jgi:hypothetical protein
MTGYGSTHPFRKVTDDAVVTIESSRTTFLQGLYSMAFCFGAIFGGSMLGAGVPVNVVVRDCYTDQVVYSQGPYFENDADTVANEIYRAIQIFGLQAFMNAARVE